MVRVRIRFRVRLRLSGSGFRYLPKGVAGIAIARIGVYYGYVGFRTRV